MEINMKKITAVLLSVFLCAFVLAGCGSQPKEEETTTQIENDAAVLGTWSEDYFDSGYTFNSDGTGMDTFWQLSFTYTALDGVITITYDDTTYGTDKYNYSVDETGSSITMTRQGEDSKSFTYKKN